MVALLTRLGFRPLVSDTATYYHPGKGIFIVSHVDDCLLIRPSLADINALKRLLAETYDIEDLGPAKWFLGIEIERNRRLKTLLLHQRAYTTEVLEHFGLPKYGPDIPLSPGLTTTESTSPALNKANIKLYQRLVGSAMYNMVMTRPDINYPLGFLSRALQSPTEAHLKAIKRLISYLYGSLHGIHYSASPDHSITPVVYSDSDFAACKLTARSTYRYVVIVAGGPVAWKSKRASSVVLSTLEAKFVGLIEANREILWLRGLYKEIQRPLSAPTPLKGDNQGAISTAHSAKHHNRTKHTLIRFHSLRESVAAGDTAITYIPTGDMVADGLTKALNSEKFQRFIALLNLSKVKL